MRNLWNDISFGLRLLRKNPGFTAIAVLTLGLGIGANTALFSIVDWLLLRPLPISAPNRVTFLTIQQKGRFSNGFSYPDFADIRTQTSEVFSDMAGYDFGMEGLTADGRTQPMQIGYVTGSFFPLAGIKPLLGRFILPTEGTKIGADPVLVLSYAYWSTRFGGDSGIIGKQVAVNGVPVTIVGVAPRGFHGLFNLLDTQGYMPNGMRSPEFGMAMDFMTNRAARSMVLMARLRDGATLEQARAAAKVVADRLAQQYPDVDGGLELNVWNLGPMGPAGNPEHNPLGAIAGLFLGLALLVLVLACLNVANMLLVRATVRQREMAIRTALGAARGRLIRQLLAESMLLAMLGCAAGLFLGLAASRAISSMNLRTSFPVVLDFQFDWRVFAYSFAMAALTGILAGLVPALRASRANLGEVLHDAGRSATGGKQRMRGALVAAQVAGSMMLLVIAGLFTRSLGKAQSTDLGFDPKHVLNLTMDPHEIGYNESEGRVFFKQLLDRVQALPGIQSASLAATVPGGEVELGGALNIDGRPVDSGQPKPSSGNNYVTAQYLQTMGIALVRGRSITDADEANTQYVAVIDERMAKEYWPNQDPIGRRFSTTDDPKHSIEVVGIVKISKSGGLADQDEPYFYAPLSQHYISMTTLQIRVLGAPEAETMPVMQAVQSLAPTMPVYGVQTMTQALKGINGTLLFQFGAGIAASLGILGLLLATIGLYGVVSFSATQRTREIGIRMALGARPAEVLRMICSKGLTIIGIGLVIGAGLALAVGRLVGGFLIGIAPTDPATFITVGLMLALVGTAASYIPALRASRVDPIVALRHE